MRDKFEEDLVVVPLFICNQHPPHVATNVQLTFHKPSLKTMRDKVGETLVAVPLLCNQHPPHVATNVQLFTKNSAFVRTRHEKLSR